MRDPESYTSIQTAHGTTHQAQSLPLDGSTHSLPDKDEPPELMRMFRPRAVALVGVSGRADSILARPLRYLRKHGFAGDVYPVNPRYEELDGRPCYPSLADVPTPIDLVLVMVPAAQAPEVVREAGRAGAAAAIVFSSGFAETGADGAALQRELQEAARTSGVRVLGPNCQGLLHASNGLTATFTAAADRTMPPPSGVAYVGQSGAVGGSVLDLAAEMGLGLSAWVSTGNQADLDVAEVATALLADPDIAVIMLYVEALGDGAAYRKLAERAHASAKHLVVLRAGRSQAGRRAVASHTGAMLADDTGFVLTSRRYGVLVVDDVDDLLAVAATLSSTPSPRGPRVAVVTTSGGAGGLAADRLEDHQLAMPELAAATQAALAPHIPAFGALANPVDVTAQLFNQDVHAFGDVCRIVAGDHDVDAVVVLLTMITGDAAATLAEDLVKTIATLDKPLLVVWLAGHELTGEARRIFHDASIPVFNSIAGVARVLSIIAPPASDPVPHRFPSASLPQAPPGLQRLRSLARSVHRREDLGAAILDAVGIAQPASELATSAGEAAAAASRLGVTAMKVQAAGLAHKSDVGGVALGVSPQEADAAYRALMETAASRDLAGVDGVQLQQMVAPGLELIVGAIGGRDGFPGVVTVGFGGVATEIYRDIATALAPVEAAGAEAMLRELRAWPLLAGFRGAAPADVEATVAAIVAVGWAITALQGQVDEIEINPLIVASQGGGAVAVDVLVR